MLKKILPVIILVGLIIVGIRLFTGPEDVWKKNNQGVWIRHGNPTLPIPQDAVRDCYQQNSNRAFDIAYILCREDLCGSDRSCARFLETAFEEIKMFDKSEPSSNPKDSLSEQQPNNTNQQQSIQTPSPLTTPTTTPTSTPPVTDQEQIIVNTNTNAPISEPSQSSAPALNSQREEQKTNQNITIETPTPGASVTSPIVITGTVKAAVGEPIDIQITTKSGTVLIGETANLKASGPDGWGSYKITIGYVFSSTRDGFVVISHGDDRASVAVTFN